MLQQNHQELLGVDLRISDRNDCQCHQMFYYIVDESVLYNIRYALIFDSLRPANDDESVSSVGNSKSEWMSYSRAKKVARQYQLLLCIGESQELIPLVDESMGAEMSNTNLMFEGCSIILIKKEYAQIRISMQNRRFSDELMVEEETKTDGNKEGPNMMGIDSEQEDDSGKNKKKRGTENGQEEEDTICVDDQKLPSERDTSSDSDEMETDRLSHTSSNRLSQ